LRVIGPCACEHLPLDIMVYRDERIPKSRAARMLRERVLEPADRLSAAVCVHDDTTHTIFRAVSSARANSRTRSACSAGTHTSTRTIPALRCLSRCLLLRSAASAEGSRGEGEATDGAHEPRFFSDVFR